MNTILICILIILLLYLFFLNKDDFNLQTGVKRGFSRVYSPYPPCYYSNNCFPGYYFRSEEYKTCH